MTTDPVIKTPGSAFDLGVVYTIDNNGLHTSSKLIDIVQGKRLVFFGGPAPFSRLDTEQCTEYARLSQQMMDQGVNMVFGIYVQDAFVCQAFEAKIDNEVGANPLAILADGDAFFVRSNGLENDYTFQGLSVRSHRWAAVVNDGKVEYFVSDPYQVIEKTRAENILTYLKNDSKN